MNSNYQSILDEYSDIQKKLSEASDGEQLRILGKRQKELDKVVKKIQELNEIEKQLQENEKLLKDEELKNIAEEEKQILNSKILLLNSELQKALIPRDPLDEKNALLEIRAAAGGDKSGLFAAELFRMYQKYSESKSWKFFILSSNHTSVGGFKEVICEVRGVGSYGHLKYESGVHRVQRVPETEKSGRVHTSTVTVAVLPELEEKEFEILGMAKQIEVEGLGSILVGSDPNLPNLFNKVIVRFEKGTTLGELHELLSILHLEKALYVSNEEDIERLKVGHLFHHFFPRAAIALEETEEFAYLPLE